VVQSTIAELCFTRAVPACEAASVQWRIRAIGTLRFQAAGSFAKLYIGEMRPKPGWFTCERALDETHRWVSKDTVLLLLPLPRRPRAIAAGSMPSQGGPTVVLGRQVMLHRNVNKGVIGLYIRLKIQH
jgi:hypothetical protein